MIQRIRSFVHSRGLTANRIRHLPGLRGRGDDVPGTDGPGSSVECGDVDALNATGVYGTADVEAAGANSEVGAVDGPGVIFVGAATGSGGWSEFGKECVAAVIRI